MAITKLKKNNIVEEINDSRLPSSLGTSEQVLKMNSSGTSTEWGTISTIHYGNGEPTDNFMFWNSWEEEIDYLKMTSLLDGSTVGLNSLSSEQTLEYSIDDGETWNNFDTTTTITLNDGNYALFRGEGYSLENGEGYTNFSSTGRISLSGDVTTIINGVGNLEVAPEYCFYSLFDGAKGIVSAKDLILPSITLSKGCYECMFFWSGLEEAPELPAVNMADSCYDCMFTGTFITKAPELPATTLAEGCYAAMFLECSLLVDTPELPAMELAENCYYSLFYDSPLVNKVVASFNTWENMPYKATDLWLSGASSTGDFYGPDPGATRTASTVPEGWTVHTI